MPLFGASTGLNFARSIFKSLIANDHKNKDKNHDIQTSPQHQSQNNYIKPEKSLTEEEKKLQDKFTKRFLHKYPILTLEMVSDNKISDMIEL